jgi:hypothetical protein
MLSFDLTEDGWFDGLPKGQKQIIQEMLNGGKSEEQVGEFWLSGAGSESTAGFGSGIFLQSFFTNVKQEFINFVCGDPKYEAERKQVNDLWHKHGKVAVVSFVAAEVAKTVGLACAAVIPVVALLFSSTAKIGVNAFCTTCKPAKPLPPTAGSAELP